MNKAISTLVAAVAALTLSAGAFAQAAGGTGGNGSSGSTAGPANQVNSATMSGYGTPGVSNSDSGMAVRPPNSGLPSSNTGTMAAPAPKTNNTLATPSVMSPAAGQ